MENSIILHFFQSFHTMNLELIAVACVFVPFDFGKELGTKFVF